MVKSDKEIVQAKADAYAKLQSLYASIMKLAEDTVPLYDIIEDFFFQDIDYRFIIEKLPPWGGRGTGTCPELKNQCFAKIFPQRGLNAA